MRLSFSLNGEKIPWSDPAVQSLEEAVFYAIVYADIYDYPLTLLEITRYLVGQSASRDRVAGALGVLQQAGYIRRQKDYFMLAERTGLAARRLRRAEVAETMWPRALAYGRAIARMPFVRMVAITGALPSGNVELGDDIDYLMITEPGRLWLTRLLIIQLVVKPAARHGDEVCPNYFLSERALTLQERDLFHAYELAQMVPIYGLPWYQRLRKANAWADQFLPNAVEPPRVELVSEVKRRALPEALLSTRPVAWLERKEMARMQTKLTREASTEVEVTPDRCKGHVGGHGHLAGEAFAARIRYLVNGNG
jgi:hypothetical protein